MAAGRHIDHCIAACRYTRALADLGTSLRLCAPDLCAGNFHEALRWMQDEWYQELDECECLVCNLICRNYIKGYVSHAQGVVVLSKQNPYPPPDQLTLADPL